jgi:hypothetical protein
MLAPCFMYIGEAPFSLRNEKFFYGLKKKISCKSMALMALVAKFSLINIF